MAVLRFLLLALLFAATPIAADDLACPTAASGTIAPATPPGTSAVVRAPRTEPLALPHSSVEPDRLPAAKRTRDGRYFTAEEAGIVVGLYGEDVLFVDVRTRGELIFTGMPTLVDAHVPWLLDPLDAAWNDATHAYQLRANPDFVVDVEQALARKGLDRSDVVIVICQAGMRAARAADALAAAGFERVYAVVDGFEGDPATEGPRKGQRVVNGWRNAGLPWSMQLDRSKMYRVDAAPR